MKSVIRLIEHQPAWELHLFLRICGIPYTTDYSITPIALGRPLPILIDQSTIYSGEGCFRYLSQQYSSYSNIESIDELVSSYLKIHLYQVFHDYLHVYRYDHMILQRNNSWVIQWQESNLLRLEDILFYTRHLLYPDYTAKQLNLKLLKTYSLFDEKLQNWEDNSLLANWSNEFRYINDQYGIADALFYGHLARILTEEEFASFISSHENIMRYFESLNSKYFISTDVDEETELYWNVSLQVLLNNPYLKNNVHAFDLLEALEVPQLNLTRYLQLQDVKFEDAPSRWITTKAEENSPTRTTPVIDQEGTLQSFVKSKSWIITTAFQFAVGASFIGYFFNTSHLLIRRT